MRGANPKEIEATGVDVEEAIARGLARLGVSREKAQIEVLDEGSRGLLGLGRRDAVVRLRVISAEPRPAKETREPAPAPRRPPERKAPEAAPPARQERPPAPEKPPVRERPERPAPPSRPSADRPAPARARDAVAQEVDPEALQAEAAAAQEVWQTLLGKLQVEATITTRLSEPDEVSGRQVPILDVTGRDLSVLIGPRGDTLNSLQFITRIMVAHQLKRRAFFVVDVEGYRERRAQALARLAERMAQKAIQRGRPVTLEPMPPNERRVIHMALRDVEGVYTQSTGEGNGRRVRILLK